MLGLPSATMEGRLQREMGTATWCLGAIDRKLSSNYTDDILEVQIFSYMQPLLLYRCLIFQCRIRFNR